jgi:nucleoside recognition membrane protein YjiH
MQAIMIHNIGNAVSAFVLTEYSEVAIVVMSSIHWMLIEKVVEISLYEYLMIFIMAVLGFITQSSLTKSFGLGDVTQLQLVANC